MPVSDEDAAVMAIAKLVKLTPEQQSAKSNIELLLKTGDDDSFVDIHELFGLFNILYFRSLLVPRVEVSWSNRLTLSAGLCELIKDDQGEYRRVRVKLSSALLQFRPRSDMVNTLLHEAIHAYFFITTVFAHVRDPTGGHGPGFQRLASAINNHGGYDINQFHEFHDEVDSFRRHVWQCDGPCREQPPHYGLVKRVMNRPPGKTDIWWDKHENECGGTYSKIAEPEKTKKQLAAMSGRERAGRQKNKIDSWLKKDDSLAVPQERPNSSIIIAGTKRARSTEGDDSDRKSREKMVDCPICSETVTESGINGHLDAEHPI